MSLTRLTPVDGDAILTLEDAKLHLRVDSDDEDMLIMALRDAAIAHVEKASGVILARAEYRWSGRSFAAVAELPVRPVRSIVAVRHRASDGAEIEYDGAQMVDGVLTPALGEMWPNANGFVAVTFEAGLASADLAPDLIAAAKLMLGHLYRNREAVQTGAINELPLGVAALIDPHRKVMV